MAVGLLALTLASCSGQRMRDKIRIDGIERVRPQGLSHLYLELRTTNDSGRNLKVRELTLAFYYGSSAEPTVTATLLEPVTLRKHTSGGLPTKWRLAYADLLAWMPLLRAVGGGSFDGWRVAVQLKGRCGVMPINISSEALPLSTILRTFGVDTKNLEKLIQS